jgi:ElaB/YqjD/DUF883 family membrane-anchored ribosome-binding protein
MDQSTGEVQLDREKTRAAITEKIELLEERVRDTVEGAKTRVKQSFNIRYHVDRRPWQMVGLSILAGYLVGRLTANSTSEYARQYWRRGPMASQETAATATSLEDEVYAPSGMRRSEKRSWGILDQFQDELAALRAAAIGAVVSVVRDLIKSATATVQESASSLTSHERRTPAETGQTGRR